MLKTVTRDSIFITCILFTVCPKKTQVIASTIRSKPALRINQAIAFPKINSPVKWALVGIKDEKENSVSSLKEAEPGFDFTDEEMVKLKLWPEGIIPYYIDDLSFDKVLRDRIRSFLEVVSGLTGLYFLELPTPPEDAKTRWVFFINRRGQLGCNDHSIRNFTNEGVQKVILGYDCMTTGGEMTEAILALAGVPPQHNAPNRDEYISVVMENIMPDKKYLFDAVKDDEWLFHELQYDFSSAGHYHFHKYSINGSATISPVKPALNLQVGEGNGLSYTDILKIRMLYNFISKRKSNIAKVSSCDKIFEAGTNFSSYKPNDNYLEPRKKPNKYLGLPDEENDNNDNENNSQENNDNDTDRNKVVNDEADKKNDQESSDTGSGTDINKLTYDRSKKKQPKKDPLSYLSDYQTDDSTNNNKYKKTSHIKENP